NGRHATAPAPQARTGRPLAAPATRRLAREAGLDLAEVRGTGPSGRITREDLLAHLDGRAHQPSLREAPIAAQVPQQEAAPAAPRPAATPPPPRPSFPAGPRPEQRIPLRGLRKRIAEKMRTSVDTAAHFTYVEECDMTELVKLRDSAEDLAKARGVKLSYLPFIIKAIIAGLKEYPYLNATLDDATQEIVLKGYYNIGIGAATDEGLTVFVVKDCDRKSMLDIAADIQYLGEAARTGTLKIDDLQGGTFTITSLGALGGILATPVINHPEVAILGVHKIRKRPVVRDDQIVVRDICYLSISLDHRVIDGHVGAQFMQRVVQLLEDPWLLMLGA
ncbi:MAG: 2-oxo acid dehydrogenase subunit E2, partial [Armatimonadetes bacterium]|nr:2-oxo acid dehydrogenase subunit E2 [Armatimonadota bacterium]